MTYRCGSCRDYHRGAPYRKVGLSSICSEPCLQQLRTGTRQAPRPMSTSPAESVRGAVMVRDRGRCRWCGTTANLHVHHIAYRSEGVDDSEHNLIVLCLHHHGLVHSDKPRFQALCRAYIWILYADGKRRYLGEIERQLSSSA